MVRIVLSCFMLMSLFATGVWAQERVVSGTVTSAEDGSSLPGVNVVLKGTTQGTITDVEGNYKISVPSQGGTLTFSFIGLATQEAQIGTRSVVDIVLAPDTKQLSEVVVTALGISREERSLGYAVSEVSGEEVSRGQENNVVTALSGKAAGVQVRQPNTFGGSANILIRGTNSLTGNNQPLFVVDGIPIDGGTYNDVGQASAGGGYDYGNVTQDINPADIETISILKGASAAALYGSRAMNGVVFITTKKGAKRKGVGLSISSSATFERLNENTIPKHQNKYGAGYGAYYGPDGDAYFDEADIDGDGDIELLVPYGEDASWGAPLNGTQVVHWDALDPNAPNYAESRPYSPTQNSIDQFFETGLTLNNTIAIDGGGESTTFRLSYTNMDATGILPNQEMQKNIFTFSGTHNLSEKLTASTTVSFNNTYTLGRGGTGYDGLNVMQSFGQWYQAQLDMDRLKNYRTTLGGQYTWNANAWNNLRPHYFNNPYWVRYENYQDDERNRLIGNVILDYKLTDWLTLNGQVSNDFYDYLQEERVAVGSLEVPEYRKKMRTFNESNFQFLANINQRFGDNFSLTGLLGTNLRKRTRTLQELGTAGGLVIEDLYAISNSVSSAISQQEGEFHLEQQSVFASASLGWRDMLFVDATARNDWSSTLPENNNSYFYPSVSGSFVFTELVPLQDSRLLSFGKIRLNYAEVGNDAAEYLTDIYYTGMTNLQTLASSGVPMYAFRGASLYSLPNTLNNVNLKPENQKSVEAGFDLRFLNDRLGLDATFYRTNTFNQILDAPVSRSSGYFFKWINAGEIENKGIEVVFSASPVRSENFNWNMNVNWARNVNRVVTLTEDLTSYQLASSFFTTIEAREGEPYGTIVGPNYVYHENGEPIVGEDGFYLVSEGNEVLGNPNPDWIMGINNTFSFRGFALNFLIDSQKGGEIFSENTMFGRATGLYEETATDNSLGNPQRDPVDEGGGILLPGVNEDGTPNDVFAPASDFFGAYYYGANPMSVYVFDASYIKLRELSLTYSLPTSLMANTPFLNASISFVGRNLAILFKNTKHFDPEATQSAGNIQGFENGANPSTRTFGLSLKFGI